MMNGVGLNNVRNTPAMQSGRNLTSSTQGLSYRETEILNQIQSTVGGPVKINLGSTCEISGFTIAFKGFGGASASGVRDPFMVTKNMLREMAENENKYNEWMSWVREQMQQQTELESWLSNNKRMAEQEDAERRSHQIRVNMMSVLDFWNDNRTDGHSWSQPVQGQAFQNMVGRYEQMLSGQ